MSPTSKPDGAILGLAGEFLVAAELCRRGIYAQPTFGNQKRMDLLAAAGNGNMLHIEVKTKQGLQWPNCKGLGNPHAFLVMVDMSQSSPEMRPDFYILSASDWCNVLKKVCDDYQSKHPGQQLSILPNGLLLNPHQRLKSSGKPLEGYSARVADLAGLDCKEAWWKIKQALQTDNAGTRTTRRP